MKLNMDLSINVEETGEKSTLIMFYKLIQGNTATMLEQLASQRNGQEDKRLAALTQVREQ